MDDETKQRRLSAVPASSFEGRPDSLGAFHFDHREHGIVRRRDLAQSARHECLPALLESGEPR